MDWIDIVWPTAAAASVMLGLIHIMVGLRRRDLPVHLALAAVAFSATAIMLFELAMARAESAAVFARALRMAHFPVALLAMSLVAYVWIYTGAARLWLALTAVGLRLSVLWLHLLSPVSIGFLSIDAVRSVEFLGAIASIPVGQKNPLTLLPQLANLVLIVYVVDAWLRARRVADGQRRRRLATAMGSLVAFLLVTDAWLVLMKLGIVASPYITVGTFSIVFVAMSFHLVLDLLDAARLSSELRARETQLRESEQRMELAVAAANLALWKWDVERGSVWLSQRGVALLGFTDSPVKFDMFLGRVHPEDRMEVRVALGDAAREVREYQHEFRLAHDDGTIGWIGVQGRASIGDDGHHIMHGVANDVTSRRTANERIRGMEREAAQQRDELAHLSRVSILSELSGSLAHELNQPLAAILSNAQAAQRYLERTPVDLDELRAIVADIVDNDRRAGEVIKRLRAMLKKEAAHYVPLDLNDVVFDALRLMRSDLLNRNVSVQWRPADRLPEVAGDRVQLQQVLLNLVTNGCDAMTDQSEAREIRIRTVKGAGTAQIEVADAGKGIAEAEIERVFEPFVTTKPDGMGLGLAVCRSIVAAHGGRIWATRNGGRGTTVHVELPALHRVVPTVSLPSSNVT